MLLRARIHTNKVSPQQAGRLSHCIIETYSYFIKQGIPVVNAQVNPDDSVALDIGHLYRQHHGWLERWLGRRTNCSAQAAELAHDTFVRLLARRRQGTDNMPVGDPQAYLATIARGLLIDEWRRKDIERAWLDTLAAQPEPYAVSPEETFEVLQVLQRIDQMLTGLRAPVCEAFILAKLDGLTCAEVAARMQLSIATVERHIAHALRRCYDIVFAD